MPTDATFRPVHFKLFPQPPSTDTEIPIVSSQAPRAIDETYEVYDPSTLTTPISPQRQQHHHHHRQDPSQTRRPDPSTAAQPSAQPPASSSQDRAHVLRRSAHQLPRSRPGSPDLIGPNRTSVRFATRPGSAPGSPRAARNRNSHSEQHTEGDLSSYYSSLRQNGQSFWPQQSTRVSSRTASAILWALEEAIRKPFLFTPDQVELNASMSELLGGPPPVGSTGDGPHKNGASRTSVSAPAVPPSNPHPPSGVRTPTEIMRQRRDREARKRAEQGARERDQREAELRLKQEQEQQQLEAQQTETQAQLQQFPQPGRQHTHAAGVAGETVRGQRRQTAASSRPPEISLPQDPGMVRERSSAGGATGSVQPTVPGPSRRQDVPSVYRETGGSQPQPTRQRGSSVSHGQQRPTAQSQSSARVPPATYSSQVPPSSQARQAGPSTQQPSQTAATTMPQAQQGPQTQASSSQQPQSQAQQQQQPRTRPTFPHAFERWETLSSHWEGLTGYWIRRLEQNNEEISRDPLNQQLSRQVTDLSAAGANLFHAVVELQRLRASSERKFQRWFFDTRAEQERFQEVQADMERALRTERQAHSEAVSAAKQAQADKVRAEELAKEMRRELQISKEEARRAWEELGRREQEERDRTISLRSGEPTIVGGVQVVPMIQGMPSRQTSTNRPPTREGPYPGGPGPTSMGGQTRQAASEPAEQYAYERQVSSPTETDPFIESSRPLRHEADVQASQAPSSRLPPTSAAAMSTAQTTSMQSHGGVSAPTTALPEAPIPSSSHGGFYQHNAPPLHAGEIPEGDDRSYVPSTEGGGSDIGSEEYEIDPSGAYHRDSQGRRIEYPREISDDSDDYDNPEHEGTYVPGFAELGREYGAGPPTSLPGEVHVGYGQGVDYSGAGWGAGSGWDSVTPRHRHPTRLSDVLEEDERSRTSPSRASQASRSMH